MPLRHTSYAIMSIYSHLPLWHIRIIGNGEREMTQAYKGYLIIATARGDYIVEKDRCRIATRSSLAAAKAAIDVLTS